MADYITLLGAEQVQSAANTIRSAAEDMSRVSNSIAYSLEQNQRFMDDWLQRFEQVLEKLSLTAATETPK